MMITTYLLLLLAACILSEGLHPLPQTRIINGKYIEIEKVPWQVSIQVNGGHSCGGSIYSDRIIITAAHCFYISRSDGSYRLLDNKEFLIVAGSEFKRSRETIAGVSAKMHHVDFSMADFYSDIGIMQLMNPVPISNKVKPIPLAVENPATGSEVLSTGWGLTDNDPIIRPEVLQFINMNIESFDSCYISTYGLMRVDLICFKFKGKGPCKGDSGGPLVFNNTLVGVVSFGEFTKCGGHEFYASVAYYRKWILSAIKSIQRSKKLSS